MTSSGTACGPVSREGVVLGPTRLSVWGQRVLVFGPGMTAALEARLLVVWGSSSSSSFQVVGEVLLGQLSATDVYM